MRSGTGVCECWRLTSEGVHGSRACVYYGMHATEVAALKADEERAVTDYEPFDKAQIEYVRNGVCLLCGGGVLNNGEHIEPERHAAEVARITGESAVTDEMVERATHAAYMARAEPRTREAGEPEGQRMMHESHQAFYTDDGALSCRRCIICECHMPKQAAEQCPNALPTVLPDGSE